MNNYKFKEVTHPLTGDIMWLINDISLPLGGVSKLIEKYITKFPKDDYTLSIYDTRTSKTIEITCDISEMPKIVEYIYHTEKGTPLTFVAVNSFSESYVVGMSISRGRIEFGHYIAEDGKLILDK